MEERKKMKKRAILAAIAVFMTTAVLFAFAGCSGSGTCAIDSADNAVVITAEKAPAKAGGIGYISVDDGAAIVVTPTLEGEGSVTVEFYLMQTDESEQSIDELPPEVLGVINGNEMQIITGSSAAAQTLTVTGTDPCTVEVDAGEYMVNITAAKGTTGKVVITTESSNS